MFWIVSGLIGRGTGAVTRGGGATGGATQDLRFALLELFVLLLLFCRVGISSSFLGLTEGKGAARSSSSSAPGPVMTSWNSLASRMLLRPSVPLLVPGLLAAPPLTVGALVLFGVAALASPFGG